MQKNSNYSKQLFIEAKQRMLNNTYGEYSKDRSQIFYLNNRRLTNTEIKTLTQNIEEFLQSDDLIYDPLNRLILHQEEYESLDEAQKVKYTLELSKIYVSLKSRLNK